jgi:hypothetical protein
MPPNMPPLFTRCQEGFSAKIFASNAMIYSVFACSVDVSGRSRKWGLVPQRGFEPLTHALRMRCSTN